MYLKTIFFIISNIKYYESPKYLKYFLFKYFYLLNLIYNKYFFTVENIKFFINIILKLYKSRDCSMFSSKIMDNFFKTKINHKFLSHIKFSFFNTINFPEKQCLRNFHLLNKRFNKTLISVRGRRLTKGFLNSKTYLQKFEFNYFVFHKLLQHEITLIIN